MSEINKVNIDGTAYDIASAEEVAELKSNLTSTIYEESEWNFDTQTNAGIVETARFSASVCTIEGNLESVKIKTRHEDSGSVSICLAEITGSTATIYAVLPITLHTSPDVNIEYVNGVDFNYSNKVRQNTIFGVWASTSVQVNYGTETVKSYATSTSSPLNHEFSLSPNSYNVAVAYKVSSSVPKSIVKNVYVFGDSWTDIVNTTYTRWPVLLNSLDDFYVKSYGVTGSNITSHVGTQISDFISENPEDVDACIIMGGINDYRSNASYTSLVTAIQDYVSQINAVYPSARIIYLANNQLFFTQHQLRYFNRIVEELRRSGIEAYTMFGWCFPNQYSTTDLLHVGNAGNKLIANNIRALLSGGSPVTVLNHVYYTYEQNGQRIGNFEVFEEWHDGLPDIIVQGLATSTLANTTFTKTVSASALYLSVSASYAVFPCQRTNRNAFMSVYTPVTETLDSNNQLTSFDLTFAITTAGATFVTEGKPRWYN